MSTMPRRGSITITQKWNDVPNFSFWASCDLCKSKEKVKEGQIPLTGCAITHRVVLGSAYWRLCQKCHEAGWDTPCECFSGFNYYNGETGEFKHVI